MVKKNKDTGDTINPMLVIIIGGVIGFIVGAMAISSSVTDSLDELDLSGYESCVGKLKGFVSCRAQFKPCFIDSVGEEGLISCIMARQNCEEAVYDSWN